MANITTLHWNIETYGPSKWLNGNNAHFIQYIATLVNNVNADIFSMVEVKNSIGAGLVGQVITEINTLQGILAANNPWRSVRVNSGYNAEAYIVMYRTDRNFRPYNLINGAGVNVVPENGLGNQDAAGNPVGFPGRMTPNGGRRPLYVTFQTTDTMNFFSVFSYHAMFGAFTPFGIQRLPSIDFVTQFDDGPPATAIPATLIAGDFNVQFWPLAPGFYANVLALPSQQATDDPTTIQNNPLGGDDPQSYLASSYDNIFQRTPGAANVGLVTNLMVESSVITGPQPPPPAAQPNVGNLSAIAGNYNLANIGQRFIGQAVTQVPPADMEEAWRFVRTTISNHYPVSVVTTI